MSQPLKSVLITGVSSGIGKGIAQELMKRGYQVFGSVRKAEDAQAFTEQSTLFHPIVMDVTQLDSIVEAATKVKSLLKGSGLTALINNAGIALEGPLMHMPLDEVKQQFEVNVFGLLAVTQAFLPLLGAQRNIPFRPGRILNISSVAGKISAPFIGAYASSKHAVEGISQSLRRELQLYGIDVIIIGPGSVQTPIWQKGLDASPYLATDYAESIQKFNAYCQQESTSGFTTEEMGKLVADILETPKPKTRYALEKQRIAKWIIPNLLPDRLLDKLIGKDMSLIKAG